MVKAAQRSMALPSLSRLSLQGEVGPPTGGAADGRAVAEDAEGAGADLRVVFARVMLESITTLDEACRQLSQWNWASGAYPLRAVNKNARDAMRLALRKDGLSERLAERVMRAEMALADAEGLPADFTMWWSLLQEACRQLKHYRNLRRAPHATVILSSRSFLWRCRTIVLELVRLDGKDLVWVHPRLKEDREVVLAAVRNNGYALRYASRDFRKDKGVVLAAVSQDGEALQHASADLKKDRDVVLAAVRRSGMMLFSLPAFSGDREVVLAAVSNDGYALRYASEELRRDREVALAAVSEDGRSLWFVPRELRDDKDLTLAAVEEDGIALQYALQKFKSDPDVVLMAIRNNSYVFNYASDTLKNDRAFLIRAVTRNPNVFHRIESSYKADPDLRAAAGLV